MPKLLIEVSYTLDGVKRLRSQGGSARVAEARESIEGLGGALEAFHFAFGGTDAYLVAQVPDWVTATVAESSVCGDGEATARSSVVVTPAEVDANESGIVASFLS